MLSPYLILLFSSAFANTEYYAILLCIYYQLLHICPHLWWELHISMDFVLLSSLSHHLECGLALEVSEEAEFSFSSS